MAGLLDRFQKVFSALTPAGTPARTPAQQTLAEIRTQVSGLGHRGAHPENVPAVLGLLEGDPALQRDALLEALTDLSRVAGRDGVLSVDWWDTCKSGLVNLLLARQLPLETTHAVSLLRGIAQASDLRKLALGDLLRQLERLGRPFPPELEGALAELAAAAQKRLPTRDYRKLVPRLAALRGASHAATLDSGGAFSEAIFVQLPGLPADEAAAWRDLFQLGFTCAGARPTAKWAKEMNAVIARLGQGTFSARAKEWLALGPTPGAVIRDAYVPDTDVPFLRALVFAVGVSRRAALAREVGELALACFRKIPNRGPVSQAAGNACLWTLGEVGLDGVGQLGMLKMRVKYTVALRLIAKALTDAAQRAGLSVEDLEEIGVPTFELDDHSRSEQRVGDVVARLEVVGGSDVKLSFVPDGGKPQASPPAGLKGAAELKALKARVKELDAMLLAQRLRLERVYLTGRAWPFETWRTRLLEHPLLQGLVKRLIWQLGPEGSFAWGGERLVDAGGATVEPGPDDEVTLWHPIDRPEARAAAWRRWLEEHDVETPFKQLDRETYVLPRGENRTGQFSGRRVAQHRFHALCRERGWHYRLQGEFDSQNNALLTLPKWGVNVALEVAPPHATGTSGMGIYLEVETGDVVFEMGPPPPARVISEVLRDVALFVEA